MENQIKCPRCTSFQLSLTNKRFSTGRAIAGGIIAGGIGAAIGATTSNEVKIHCLNCGLSFTTAERLEMEQKNEIRKKQLNREPLNGSEQIIAAQGSIKILAFVIACIIFFGMCSSTTLKSAVRKPSKTDALIASFDCCRKILKSPRSAEFEYGNEEQKVLQINDYTFELANHVDSQNSFGAMLRAKYFCKLTFASDGRTVTCDECFIVPE